MALLETELKFDMNFITTTQATTRKAAERAAATGFPLLKILSFPTCSHFGPVFMVYLGRKKPKNVSKCHFESDFVHKLSPVAQKRL